MSFDLQTKWSAVLQCTVYNKRHTCHRCLSCNRLHDSYCGKAGAAGPEADADMCANGTSSPTAAGPRAPDEVTTRWKKVEDQRSNIHNSAEAEAKCKA